MLIPFPLGLETEAGPYCLDLCKAQAAYGLLLVVTATIPRSGQLLCSFKRPHTGLSLVPSYQFSTYPRFIVGAYWRPRLVQVFMHMFIAEGDVGRQARCTGSQHSPPYDLMHAMHEIDASTSAPTVIFKMSSESSSAFSQKLCDVAGSLGLFCVQVVWQ